MNFRMSNSLVRFTKLVCFVLALNIILIFVMPAPSALACSPPPGGFPPYTVADRVNAAGVVLEGTVVALTDDFAVYTATVAVDQYFKESGPDIVTIAQFGFTSLCLSEVSVGQKWVFYATGDPATGLTAHYLSAHDAIDPATPEVITKVIAAVNGHRLYLPIVLKHKINNLMKDNSDSTYSFLTRTYTVIKVITLAVVSIAGIAVSVVALDITVSRLWTGVNVPLYIIVLVGLPVVVLYGIFAVVILLFLKDALGRASYYKHSTNSLEKSVSYYQSLAFNDPITGIPNSRGLELELRKEHQVIHRCLILLDLINFSHINNKHNHWKGDEYLRRFADMVASKSRRDEFVFKKRPIANQENSNSDRENVKAFRKYSGGDEFYILIEGTIVDGLGYLNRLQKRSPEFEIMAFNILNSAHPFGFHAGLIAVGLNEEFRSIDERSAQCLQIAKDKDNHIRLYWNEKELPFIETDSFQEKILSEASTIFKN